MNESHRISVHTGNTTAAAAHVPAAASSKGAEVLKKPNLNGKYFVWAIIVLILVAAAGTAGYFYNRYQDSQKEVTKLKNNPTVVAQTEAQQLVDRVGKLTDLPKSESPTIATVTDITKLKGQVFFEKAQNGDKVLIYTQAKEAILYRPSTNKIINIAPVNIGSSQQSSTQGTASQQNTTSQTPAGTSR